MNLGVFRPVFVLQLTLSGMGSLLAVDEDIVFRSDVNLVRVDAQVLDGNNRAITGLQAGDFILRENGRQVEIRNFSNEEMPVDVLLLIDVSGSMRPHVERLAAAAHDAVRVLAADDRVGIMVFDRSTRVRTPFHGVERVEAELENLLRHEDFDGGTDITRALLDAAAYIGRNGRRDARRAIVILTDDQTERDRDEAGVSRALVRSDAVLSALIAPDAMRTGGWNPGGRGGSWPNGGGWPNGGPLGGIIFGRRNPGGNRGPVITRGGRTQSASTEEIARRSGGDTFSVDDGSALENTLARIRQRYALHFYLPPDVKAGEERNIEVELAANARRRYPSADVHYRREYLAPNGGADVVVAQGPDRPAPPPPDASAPAAGPQSQKPAGSWRRAGESEPRPPAEKPVLTPAPGTTDAPQSPPQRKPGWRRATPEDQEP